MVPNFRTAKEVENYCRSFYACQGCEIVEICENINGDTYHIPKTAKKLFEHFRKEKLRKLLK